MSEIRFPDPTEREKRSRLVEMLDAGKVMVYVDPRRPGVDLPAHLRGQVAVPLNLSRLFQLETFEVGPLAVRASLSFGGNRHLCVLPYRAIFGMYSHAEDNRIIFPDSLPAEVAVVEADAARSAEEGVREDGEDGDDGREPAGTSADESTKPRPGPALRLVE